jgi:signal transduction histidine kinase/DNA-binding response OmpR family regulator
MRCMCESGRRAVNPFDPIEQLERITEAPQKVAERWQRVKLLVAMAGLLILAAAGVALVQGNRLNRQLDRGSDVQESVSLLREFARLLVDLETGQRGYLLTGEPTYLEPYHAAENRLPMLSLQLVSLLNRHPDSRAAFAEISGELEDKKVELDMAIQIMRESGRVQAIEYVRSDFGRALMDQLRNKTRLLIDVLERRVDAHRQESTDLIEQRNWTIFVIVVLGLVAGSTAYWLLRGHLRQLDIDAQLRSEALRAMQANQRKSSFLANLSHEMRTPMNAIFGFTELLEDLVQSERQRFYVKAIQQSGRALLDLIDDILDLSRIEAGKMTVEPVPTDLRELFESLHTVFSQMALEKGLRLRCHVAAEVPDGLLIDPIRLRQILINLIGNAIKYTEQGEVAFRLDVEPIANDELCVACRIEVSDSGVGIAAADHARIFEPFTQVGDLSAPGRVGTGLGLSIVQRLVDLLEGRISIESELGQGTTVRLELPRIALTPAATRVPAADADLSDLAPLRIVAVDDVALNLTLLESLFATTHHQLATAAGGAEGVALVRELLPDVVLMDIRMPEVNGVQALEQIRADSSLDGVRLVAVTASSLLGEEVALRSRFDGYVRKPISRAALLVELRRLFGERSATAARTAGAAARTDTEGTLSGIDRARLQPLRASLIACRTQLERAAQTLSSSDIDELLERMRMLGDAELMPSLRGLTQTIARDAGLFDLRSLESSLGRLRAALERWISDLESVSARDASN